MIWDGKTHHFSATTCKYTGRSCPAATQMARRLAEALSQAAPVTDEDFELSGSAELTGCERRCQARFAASHSRIRIFGGTSEEADEKALQRFADAMFSADSAPLPAAAASPAPCAMVEALAKTPPVLQQSRPEDLTAVI